MPSELRLRGVDELIAELDQLVPALAAEVRAVQAAEAQQTASELRAAYPVVTGELRNSVRVLAEPSNSPGRVFTRVEVASDHAGFYEFGTARTAPHPTFTPVTRRGREAFLTEVIRRVEARGLVVNGGPANA